MDESEENLGEFTEETKAKVIEAQLKNDIADKMKTQLENLQLEEDNLPENLNNQ